VFLILRSLRFPFCFCYSYNPLERREACKGGRDNSRKNAASQLSNKSSSASARSHSSQASRKTDASSAHVANQAAKAPKPVSDGGIQHDKQVPKHVNFFMTMFKSRIEFLGFILFRVEYAPIILGNVMQITELKLSIDSLEKERDFYFAKLRDVEILCQNPAIEHLPVYQPPLNTTSRLVPLVNLIRISRDKE